MRRSAGVFAIAITSLVISGAYVFFHQILGGFFGLVIGAGLIISAVGLLTFRPWARVFTIIAALVASASMGLLLLGFWFLSALYGGFETYGDMAVIVGGLATVLIYTLLVWRYLTNPEVRELFGDQPRPQNEPRETGKRNLILCIVVAGMVVMGLGYSVLYLISHHVSAEQLRMPLPGITVENVVEAHAENEGDYSALVVQYQLKDFDIDGWVASENQRCAMWLKGPLSKCDVPYIDAAEFACTYRYHVYGFPSSVPCLPWIEYLDSDSYYFKFDSMKYTGMDFCSVSVWILDAKTSQMYHASVTVPGKAIVDLAGRMYPTYPIPSPKR